jgi:hypothetical protein
LRKKKENGIKEDGRSLSSLLDSISGAKTKLDHINKIWDASSHNDMDFFIKTARNRDYGFFLKTDYWQAIKNFCLERAEHECEACGNSNAILHVHHLTYEHHGLEHLHLDDLIVLCEQCHNDAHSKK